MEWQPIETAPEPRRDDESSFWLIGYTSWGQRVGQFHEWVGPIEYMDTRRGFWELWMRRRHGWRALPLRCLRRSLLPRLRRYALISKEGTEEKNMGWSSGSELFSKVIAAARHRMGDEERKAFYLEIIPAFEEQDWDTQDECLDDDPMFEAAYRQHSRHSR